MKVLVDECCPRILVDALQGVGFDVLYVAEAHPGVSDRSLVDQAREQGRIIVTQDYDFGEMAVRQGLFGAGLVVVACAALTPVERAQRVARVMADLAAALKDQLTIIELKRVRQRRLNPPD